MRVRTDLSSLSSRMPTSSELELGSSIKIPRGNWLRGLSESLAKGQGARATAAVAWQRSSNDARDCSRVGRRRRRSTNEHEGANIQRMVAGMARLELRANRAAIDAPHDRSRRLLTRFSDIPMHS